MKPLTDSWTEIQTTSGTVRTFTVPRAIPAGRLLVISIGRGGAGTVTAISAVGGNAWTIEGAGPHSNNTMNFALATCVVNTAISAGATFTVTASATSNRSVLSAGVFSDVVLPLNKVKMAAIVSDAKPRMDMGPTPNLSVPRALVITGCAFTSNGSPITHASDAIAAQGVTAVGSADRGSALLFKSEGGLAHTGSYNVNNSSTSVGITIAVETTDLPAGTIPYMTDDGEVPGILKVWQFGVEKDVASLEFAGPPVYDVPKKMVGMSSPASLWDTRLAQVGETAITCRRIFCDMTSNGRSQQTLIEQAVDDNMLPVVSYKEPTVGTTADINGVLAGTYDSWIANIRDYLESLGVPIISIFHHEARGDMSQAQFLEASRKWLDIMKTGTSNISVAPINMGFLLDTVNGRNEFNTWSTPDLLADWDYFGIDTYQSGTFDAPGSTLPSDRVGRLMTWFDQQGIPDKPFIIGEYNGWTTEAITEAHEVFLSNPNLFLFMVFNSDSGSKGEPLTGDRLLAFKATKADVRVLQGYSP